MHFMYDAYCKMNYFVFLLLYSGLLKLKVNHEVNLPPFEEVQQHSPVLC